MSAKKISSQEWLSIIGKEKLQIFQDSMARITDMSLVFFDLEGNNLTVWSNAPIFCHSIPKQIVRCKQEQNRILSMAREKGTMVITTCYLGLTYAIVPVFFNSILCSYVCIGIVATDNMCISGKKKDEYHIPSMDKKNFAEMAQFLKNNMDLLNIDFTLVKDTLNGERQQAGVDEFEGKLSKREVEVAKAICNGLSNKQVAAKLFVSEKTVKSHVSSILRKLDLKDRVQLVVDYCRFTFGQNGADE